MSNSKKVKDLFPHSGFPYRLEHKDGKDMKEDKICFFQCEEHMKKYIERHKFKKKDYKSSVKSEND